MDAMTVAHSAAPRGGDQTFDLAQSAGSCSVFGYATYRERLPMQTTATLIDFIPILDIAIFLGVPVLLLIVVFVQECLGRHRPEVRRIGDGRFST